VIIARLTKDDNSIDADNVELDLLASDIDSRIYEQKGLAYHILKPPTKTKLWPLYAWIVTISTNHSEAIEAA
jgi:hypothetical protein